VTARRNVPAAALAGVLAAAALAGGCGGGDDDENVVQTPPPVARPEDFPKPNGRTLVDLARQYGQAGPVLKRSVAEFEPGENRLGFGLFDRARAQIAAVPVAIYVAAVGGGPAKGPYPARYESLQVRPQFASRGVEADPDAAQAVYVTKVDLPRTGRYEVLGLARLDDRLVVALPGDPPLRVRRDSGPPEVGERAPRTDTPTREDAGGNLEEIDTRVPPSSMHDADLADVLGKRPVVLLFATPALCRSRVCGPVVDVAEEVKAERGDDAEFIHMEIYRDNQLEKGYRPQVVEWRLPTEPWLFTIDRRGRIAARIEGAFSARELNEAIDKAVRG
jgi:hypothetical protein